MAVLVVLSMSGVAYAGWFIDDAVRNDLSRTKVQTSATTSGRPENFLVIGSDSRSFVSSAVDREHFGSSVAQGGSRSDTIMVAHIDPAGGGTLLVSFPRDLWVTIPGHGQQKINAAFNHGPQTVIDTIEQNFGVPINHYLEVDFDGFRNVVNAVGSVPLFFPTIARDLMTGLDVTTPGCAQFDGERSLQYVRSRHYEYRTSPTSRWRSDPTADLGRIRRQQYFIRSLAQAAIRRGLNNPLRITGIVHSALRSLTADQGLDARSLIRLANALRDTDPGALAMQTIPADIGRSSDGQSILRLRAADAAPLLARLRSTTSGPGAPTSTLPGIPASGITVSVLNGTAVQGAARTALAALTKQGFRAGTAGNSPVALRTTEVRFGSGDRAREKAQVVAAHLGGVGRLVVDDTILDDIVTVVLGDDFRGVSAAGAHLRPTTTGAASTSSTLPANPGRTEGVQVPVTEAGRPVVGCG
jgi:LCP family protein required for cell wall assembly